MTNNQQRPRMVKKEYTVDATPGYSLRDALQKRATVTEAGREYITQKDFFETVDEWENAAVYTRPAQERLSDDELLMEWALMQDPNMTVEDFQQNVNNIPGWGPNRQQHTVPIHPGSRAGFARRKT